MESGHIVTLSPLPPLLSWCPCYRFAPRGHEAGDEHGVLLSLGAYQTKDQRYAGHALIGYMSELTSSDNTPLSVSTLQKVAGK